MNIENVKKRFYRENPEFEKYRSYLIFKMEQQKCMIWMGKKSYPIRESQKILHVDHKKELKRACAEKQKKEKKQSYQDPDKAKAAILEYILKTYPVLSSYLSCLNIIQEGQNYYLHAAGNKILLNEQEQYCLTKENYKKVKNVFSQQKKKNDLTKLSEHMEKAYRSGKLSLPHPDLILKKISTFLSDNKSQIILHTQLREFPFHFTYTWSNPQILEDMNTTLQKMVEAHPVLETSFCGEWGSKFVSRLDDVVETERKKYPAYHTIPKDLLNNGEVTALQCFYRVKKVEFKQIKLLNTQLSVQYCGLIFKYNLKNPIPCSMSHSTELSKGLSKGLALIEKTDMAEFCCSEFRNLEKESGMDMKLQCLDAVPNIYVKFKKNGWSCEKRFVLDRTEIIKAVSSLRTQIEKRQNELEKKAEKRARKERKKLEEKGIYGNLLVSAILRVVKENEHFITGPTIISLLQGTKIESDKEYRFSQRGQFASVSEDQILKMIQDMLQNGLLTKRVMSGQYGNHDIIRLGKNDRLIIDVLNPDYSYYGKEKMSDCYTDKDWEGVLKENRDFSDSEWAAFLDILDHPNVLSIYETEIIGKFRIAPENIKAYLAAVKDIETPQKTKLIHDIFTIV